MGEKRNEGLRAVFERHPASRPVEQRPRSAEDALHEDLTCDCGSWAEHERRYLGERSAGGPPDPALAQAWQDGYEVGLAAAPSPGPDLREALLKECEDARNVGIRPLGGDELRAWNYVVDHFEQFVRNWPSVTPRTEASDG